MSEPKLKTKLEFRFNVNEIDADFPDMNFIMEDPKEYIKKIKVLKKPEKNKKSSTKKLF